MPSLILILFIFLKNTYADNTQIIEGLLWEKGTKTKLSGIDLILLPDKIKATSDNEGLFRFEKHSEGPCTLIISASGYKRFEDSQFCEKKGSLKIYLEKVFYNTFETVVTGKGEKRDGQAQTLTQEEFIKMPGSFGGDPVRAAQNLPGVAQAGARAQVIVQGAGPDDTGHLINGHRVPLIFHFGGLSSVVNPNAIDRVDLLPSGYGPEYSKAMGGIVGLTTKNPKKDALHGMAFIDLLNTGLLVEGPINEHSSFLISGRYSYIGYVLQQVAKKNENFELTAAPTYADINSLYTQKINEANTLKVAFVASRDELELILNKAANNDRDLRGNFYSKTEFFRFIPELVTTFDNHTKMSNSLGIGKDLLLVDISGRYLDIDSTAVSHRFEFIREWAPVYKTYFGLDNVWGHSVVKVNLPSSYAAGGVGTPFSTGEERKFTNKGSDTEVGIYLRQEVKWSSNSPFTLMPNFRYDHFTVNKSSTLAPRFQIKYEWDNSLSFRTSWGKYTQPPKPQETAPYYGNPSIKSPYAYHSTVGFTKDLKKDWGQLTLTNNYFYKELKKLVVSDVANNYSNAGSGEILGGEIQLKLGRGPLSSQLVYTYLKSRRTTPGFGKHPSEFDQTHNLNLIGAYNLERWAFASRFRYVTGNPYTPITNAIFDSDNDVYIPKRGQLYSERFKNFISLDIRVERKFIFDEWILTSYLDIQNITNSKNSQNMRYSYNYSQKEEVRGLPILPTFGIKGEF